jgi:hypothetical protein
MFMTLYSGLDTAQPHNMLLYRKILRGHDRLPFRRSGGESESLNATTRANPRNLSIAVLALSSQECSIFGRSPCDSNFGSGRLVCDQMAARWAALHFHFNMRNC